MYAILLRRQKPGRSVKFDFVLIVFITGNWSLFRYITVSTSDLLSDVSIHVSVLPIACYSQVFSHVDGSSFGLVVRKSQDRGKCR